MRGQNRIVGMIQTYDTDESERRLHYVQRLRVADLRGAKLVDSDFTNADLAGAKLKTADLRGAKGFPRD